MILPKKVYQRRKFSTTWGRRGHRGSRAGAEVAQFLDHLDDLIFLEEADGGDAGGSGFEAGLGILQRDSAEGQDWNFELRCFSKRG